MLTMAFDTYKFIARLEKAGVARAHAVAEAEALSDVLNSTEVVTKRDLQIELSPIRNELSIMKWMIGFNLALTVTILWKIFGH